jgi:hypothetical protein
MYVSSDLSITFLICAETAGGGSKKNGMKWKTEKRNKRCNKTKKKTKRKKKQSNQHE